MGEVLIDFTVAQLDDEPFLYTLVDMDEENPLRAVHFFFFFKIFKKITFNKSSKVQK